MTVHAIMGTNDFIAAATDTSVDSRDHLTGACRVDPTTPSIRPKVHALSARYPRAVATFGLSSFTPMQSVVSVTATAARLREQLDAEANPNCSVEALTHRVAAEMLDTFHFLFVDIERRGWLPSDTADGALATGAFVGGYTFGIAGRDGPAECYFWLVNRSGVVRIERKARGERGRWWCVVSPGALSAGAAIRKVIRETPQTVERAAAMARELVEVEIASPSPGVTARGPVSVLTLKRGNPPREMQLPIAPTV